MRNILKAHGWREPAAELPAAKPLYKRILGPPTRPLRRIVNAVKNKVRQRFGSSDIATFPNDDDGVRYLLSHEFTPDIRRGERFSAFHAVPVAFRV